MSDRKNGMMVVISRDTMGEGSEELGKILIKSFIYTLTELEEAPTHLAFLNSGVHLTVKGANTVDDIRLLEEKGTEVIICGTCLNYYGFQDSTAVGKIGGMVDITKNMVSADKVINI